MRSMTIGEVAHTAGVRASAIRYYERSGVLPPANRIRGRRYYDGRVLKLLAVVTLAREAGFTVREIRALFRDFSPHTAASARWRKHATAKLEELDEVLRRTRLMRAIVLALLECRCQTLDDCGGIILRHRKRE
jgi:DNA-binding transcriptional MerR regulator